MKIALIGFGELMYMPYMYFYLKQIDMVKNDVHIICWEREGNKDIKIPEGLTVHSFKCAMQDSVPLRKKVGRILSYSGFIKKKLKELSPDFLVVMLSTTGISIYPTLVGKYKGKYIFDFRDLTYEKNFLYRKTIADIVKKSVLSFTSSDGFRAFLPKDDKLLTSHNVNFNLDSSDVSYKTDKKSPINICFWGLLRHIAINREIIKKLGNDERFELNYYGRAQGEMLKLMEEAQKEYTNVKFHGAYSPGEQLSFSKDADILHNIYSNSDSSMPHAMANKYYDGLTMYLPQLCTKDSFMGQSVTKYKVGFECDPYSPDFADSVYNYYQNLDMNEFYQCCDKEFSRIKAEVEAGNERIREVLADAERKSKRA